MSSPLLGRIAADLGVRYEETLTGFKWIANRAIALEREGCEFVFGYEEALGYCVGDVVRDKDGISAAVLAAEVAAVLRERGETPPGRARRDRAPLGGLHERPGQPDPRGRAAASRRSRR